MKIFQYKRVSYPLYKHVNWYNFHFKNFRVKMAQWKKLVKTIKAI